MTQPIQPPPALSAQQQFTPEYWAGVRREMNKATIERVTKVDDEFVEFVFKGGNAFQRRWTELDQPFFSMLHANLDVFVQTIRDELVTGLFVPEHGWVFKMSDVELAEYAKRLATAIHNQRQQAKSQVTQFAAEALRRGLEQQGEVDTYGEGTVVVIGPVDLLELAGYLMDALSQAQPPSSANA